MFTQKVTFSLLLFFFTTLFHINSNGQSDFRKAMTTLLKKDYPKFQWRDIPVNNYGVATSYSGTNLKTASLKFLSGTYSFFGLKKLPTTPDSLMIPNEMIELGCSPDVNTQIQLKRDIIFKSILPNIVSLFGFNASISDSLGKNVTIDSLEICDRRIQEGAADNYITNLPQDPLGIQRSFNNDRLVMVVRDVVIKKLKITINTGRKLATDLDAKMGEKAVKIVGDSSSLSFKLLKISNTLYTMEITTPVVVGTLAVKKGITDRGGHNNLIDDSKLTGWNKKWVITETPVINSKKKKASRK